MGVQKLEQPSGVARETDPDGRSAQRAARTSQNEDTRRVGVKRKVPSRGGGDGSGLKDPVIQAGRSQ